MECERGEGRETGDAVPPSRDGVAGSLTAASFLFSGLF